MNYIEKIARETIALANGDTVVVRGWPIGTGQLPDTSLLVVSVCGNCNIPVESTVVKEKMKELTANDKYPVQLLCDKCIKLAIAEVNGNAVLKKKTM